MTLHKISLGIERFLYLSVTTWKWKKFGWLYLLYTHTIYFQVVIKTGEKLQNIVPTHIIVPTI